MERSRKNVAPTITQDHRHLPPLETRVPDLPSRPMARPSAGGRDRIFAREELDEDAFRRMIRTLGLKVTEQRLVILDALHRGRVHITAQEVFERVVKKDSSIGFATVYRFLRRLTEGKLVTEVRMGSQPARYELTPLEHHDHISCTSCGRICEFENAAIEVLQQKVAQEMGFQLTGHILELFGLCPSCVTKSRSTT